MINGFISKYDTRAQTLIRSYTDLLYRISGARAVNSEGHFPQCNLGSEQCANSPTSLSESSIFWVFFVEAVLQHVTSCSRISSDRLDRLSYSDILEIRKSLFTSNFPMLYDNLVAQAKGDVSNDNPKEIILKAEQLTEAAERLRMYFSEL